MDEQVIHHFISLLLVLGQTGVVFHLRDYLVLKSYKLDQVTRNFMDNNRSNSRKHLFWYSPEVVLETAVSWPRRDVSLLLNEPLERLIYRHTYGTYLPPFESVLLVGPFNDWGANAKQEHRLREGGQGRWYLDFKLPEADLPSEVEFKFRCTCNETGQVVWLSGVSNLHASENGTFVPDGIGGLNTKVSLVPHTRVYTTSERYVRDVWNGISASLPNDGLLGMCFPGAFLAEPHLRLTEYREQRGFQKALDDLKGVQRGLRTASEGLRPSFEAVRDVETTAVHLVLASFLPLLGLMVSLFCFNFSVPVLSSVFTATHAIALIGGPLAVIFWHVNSRKRTTPKTTALDLHLDQLARWPEHPGATPVVREGASKGAKIRFFWYTDPNEAFSGEYSDETCLQVAAGAETLYAAWIELYGKWFFDAFLWLQSIEPCSLTSESEFHFWVEDWTKDPPPSSEGISIRPAEKLEAAHLHRKAVLDALVSLERRLGRVERYGNPSWEIGVSRQKSLQDLLELERAALREGLSFDEVPPFSHFENRVLCRRNVIQPNMERPLPLSLDDELDQMADQILAEEGVSHAVPLNKPR